MKILVIGNDGEEGRACMSAGQLENSPLSASEAEITYLAVQKNEYGCVDCQSCRLNDGDCAWKSELSEMLDQVLQADMLVFSSPVDYFNMSALLKPLVN